MTIKTRVALVVTLAVCVAPVAVAHPLLITRRPATRARHMAALTFMAGATNGLKAPVMRPPLSPSYVPYRRWQSVADEGQGRFLPCEMGDA